MVKLLDRLVASIQSWFKYQFSFSKEHSSKKFFWPQNKPTSGLPNNKIKTFFYAINVLKKNEINLPVCATFANQRFKLSKCNLLPRKSGPVRYGIRTKEVCHCRDFFFCSHRGTNACSLPPWWCGGCWGRFLPVKIIIQTFVIITPKGNDPSNFEDFAKSVFAYLPLSFLPLNTNQNLTSTLN